MLLDNLNNITFPVECTPLGRLKVTLVINAAKNDSSPPTPFYTSEQLGLKIISFPNKKYTWNDREFWFGIGTSTTEIYDPNEYLEIALRYSEFDYKTSYIEIENDDNKEIWFKGYVDSDTYEKTIDNKVKITFLPLTEILSETPVQINDVWNDIYSGKYTFDINESVNVIEFLEDTLKLIDPNFSLDVFNNWEFQSALDGGIYHYCFIDTLEVRFKSLFGWFSDGATTWQWTTTTYKDVVNNLCRALGLMLFFPMFDKGKAITYLDIDNNNIYEPNLNLEVMDYTRSKTDNLISFVTLTRRGTGGLAGTYGTLTGLNENNFNIDIPGDVFRVPDESSGTVIMSKARRDSGDSFTDYYQFLAYYYGAYLTNHFSQIKDKFTLSGLAFNLEDKLKAKFNIYFPLEIEYNIQDNETKITGRPFSSYTYTEALNYPTPESSLYNGTETPASLINQFIIIDDSDLPYTLLNSDKIIIGNGTTGGKLYIPVACGTGRILTIKNMNTGVIEIDASGGFIDGSDSNIELSQYDYLQIIDIANAVWGVLYSKIT